MVVKDYKLYNSVQGNCIFLTYTLFDVVNNTDNQKSKLINIFMIILHLESQIFIRIILDLTSSLNHNTSICYRVFEM